MNVPKKISIITHPATREQWNHLKYYPENIRLMEYLYLLLRLLQCPPLPPSTRKEWVQMLPEWTRKNFKALTPGHGQFSHKKDDFRRADRVVVLIRGTRVIEIRIKYYDKGASLPFSEHRLWEFFGGVQESWICAPQVNPEEDDLISSEA